jgi:hypothetical protein
MSWFSTDILDHVFDILQARVPGFPTAYTLTKTQVYNILNLYKSLINEGFRPPTNRENILALAQEISPSVGIDVKSPLYNSVVVIIMALGNDITPNDGSVYKWVYEKKSDAFTIPIWVKYASVIFVTGYLLKQVKGLKNG